jgi:hypothetical protein
MRTTLCLFQSAYSVYATKRTLDKLQKICISAFNPSPVFQINVDGPWLADNIPLLLLLGIAARFLLAWPEQLFTENFRPTSARSKFEIQLYSTLECHKR